MNSTSQSSKSDQVSGLVLVAVIIGVAIFGYRYIFPSDRAQVRACISALMEASRGTLDYGMLGDALDQVDAAQDVTIIRLNRTPFGANEMIEISYSVDGQRSGIVCAR